MYQSISKLYGLFHILSACMLIQTWDIQEALKTVFSRKRDKFAKLLEYYLARGDIISLWMDHLTDLV